MGPLGLLLSCTMIILYMLNMLCFDCCSDRAAMWHLIVCYNTYIYEKSFCISRYIQCHVDQSYCEC